MQVYQPCVLQTKKRYVGFAYESPLQAVPAFDAKVGLRGCARGLKGGLRCWQSLACMPVGSAFAPLNTGEGVATRSTESYVHCVSHF